mgnify:CR=1 FL=1
MPLEISKQYPGWPKLKHTSCMFQFTQFFTKFSVQLPISIFFVFPVVADRFAEEYGVVRLSAGEAMRKILSSQPHTELARQINLHLQSGNTVPDELVVQALEIALMDMQCQTRG